MPSTSEMKSYYRVAQISKPQTFVHMISLPSIDRFTKIFHWRILWKIFNKVVAKHTTTLLTASVHYFVKYKICKI